MLWHTTCFIRSCAPPPGLHRGATVRNSLALQITRSVTSFMRSNPPWVQIATIDGLVPMRVYHPPAYPARRPAMLWMHAGGFVMGDASLDDRICQRFAQRIDITVVTLQRYFTKQFAAGGLKGSNTMLGRLIEHNTDGSLTDRQLLLIAIHLLIAGNETTTNRPNHSSGCDAVVEPQLAARTDPLADPPHPRLT